MPGRNGAQLHDALEGTSRRIISSKTPHARNMKQNPPLKHQVQSCVSLVFFTLALWLVGYALESRADTPPKQNSKLPKKTEKKPEKKLNGAELYAIHCNRCHPERYATERTETQWKTILLHMRVRANLPAKEAKAILNYLQEDTAK